MTHTCLEHGMYDAMCPKCLVRTLKICDHDGEGVNNCPYFCKEEEKRKEWEKEADEAVTVVAIGEGKTIYMRAPNAKPCLLCGVVKEYESLEHSPQFQQDATAVDTLSD